MTLLYIGIGCLVFGLAIIALGSFIGHMIARGQGECRCPKCKGANN